MASLFGIHLPFSGYGSRYGVGDTIPGAAAGIQSMPTIRPPGVGMTPYGGGSSSSDLTRLLAQKLGLGGLPGATAMNAPGAPAPNGSGSAPGASQPSGWGGMLGGVGDFVDQHRGAFADIGKLAQGGLTGYALMRQVQEESRDRKLVREEAERRRRDQEAAAQLVAPAYAQIAAAINRRLGTGGG